MTSQSPDPAASDESPPRMPRWVKVSLIVVGALILLFLVLQLTDVGGQHGPARHLSSASVIVGGHV
ncbi:hypothetical protein SAMN04488074_119136 [Lentzea albidocapillata subsp. violacea]|uniref:Uncharacterized protein n=2 Tax=Lentzea TaxID=165301 RepID=A0A1G9S637_9PSEU|nr:MULTISPECIES: hypothetical protein [Lentzea]MDX8143157.1 hypothetical protein [Lentzea sp. BCCO 10_0061]SDM30979.1 hypothetical protein SAMN04488074_119136 [Lentzea albidocapillata subsp. violacea]